MSRSRKWEEQKNPLSAMRLWNRLFSVFVNSHGWLILNLVMVDNNYSERFTLLGNKNCYVAHVQMNVVTEEKLKHYFETVLGVILNVLIFRNWGAAGPEAFQGSLPERSEKDSIPFIWE